LRFENVIAMPLKMMMRRKILAESNIVDVVVVVDADYGDGLETLLQTAPVWIVDTPSNRLVYERLQTQHPRISHRAKGSITSYTILDDNDKLANLFDILPQLESHYGQGEGNYLLFPKGFVLEVLGLPLSDIIESHLQQYGLSSFTEIPDGFKARK
jgi:hypothetical protein